MAIYYSGDTAPMPITCKIGTTEYPIDLTDTVQAAFVDPATGELITVALAQLSTTSGANWPKGVVGVVLTSTEADKLAPFAGRPATMEIQVTKPTGKQTFHAAYKINKGSIA